MIKKKREVASIKMKSFSSAAVIIVASIGLAVIDARPRMCATRIFFLDGQSLKIVFGNFLPSFHSFYLGLFFFKFILERERGRPSALIPGDT